MSAAIAAATTPRRTTLRRAFVNATSTKLAANDVTHHLSAMVSVILANFTLRQINRHTAASATSTHGTSLFRPNVFHHLHASYFDAANFSGNTIDVGRLASQTSNVATLGLAA